MPWRFAQPTASRCVGATAARSSARSRRPAPCGAGCAARATGTRWCRAPPGGPGRCPAAWRARARRRRRSASQAAHRGVLDDPHAEPLAGIGQTPGQAGRVDQRRGPIEVRGRPGRWASAPRPGPASRSRNVTSAGSSSGVEAQPVDLVRLGGHGELAACARSRSRCRSDRRRPRSRRGCRRPSAASWSYSSGQRSRPLASPWVRLAAQNPPLRPDAAHPIRSPSSSTTSRSRVALLGQQRGPQPAVAAADHGEVARRSRRRAAAGRRAGPAGRASTSRGSASRERPLDVAARPWRQPAPSGKADPRPNAVAHRLDTGPAGPRDPKELPRDQLPRLLRHLHRPAREPTSPSTRARPSWS